VSAKTKCQILRDVAAQSPPAQVVLGISTFARASGLSAHFDPRPVEQRAGTFNTHDGFLALIDHTELCQYAGMTPVQVLAGDFPVFKLDDTNEPDFDASAGGRHARDQPVHHAIVRKVVDGFLSEDLLSNDLRDRSRSELGRQLCQKAVVVEAVNTVPSPAT
jgi:hypothetical protein